MKKVASVFLAALLLITGCSTQSANKKWKPQHVSDNIKPYAEKALEVIDQYLAFEISLKEFSASIEELHNRLDWDDCEENNSADTAVCSILSGLYFHSDAFTDNTLRMYRDILCFQLGKGTSGEQYLPPKNIQTYEPQGDHLVDILKLKSFPVSDVSVHISQNSQPLLVMMTFDLMNGVIPKDAFTHCETFFKKASLEGIRSDLIVYYNVCGQLAFSVDALANDSGSYTLFLNLDTGSITERKFVDPTADNIEKLINDASDYVSDYLK